MNWSLVMVLVGAALLSLVAYVRLTHSASAVPLTNRLEVFVLGICFGFMLKHVFLGTANFGVGVIMIIASLLQLRIYYRAGWMPQVDILRYKLRRRRP